MHRLKIPAHSLTLHIFLKWSFIHDLYHVTALTRFVFPLHGFADGVYIMHIRLASISTTQMRTT